MKFQHLREVDFVWESVNWAKRQGSIVHGNGCPCMGFNYSGGLHVGSNDTDLNFIVVAVTNQQIQWSKNQFIIVTCGEIVINIILDIWLDVTEDNSYVSVFYILQDVLDVRLLNQLTETESDHRAFVPIIQYKKGAI